MTSKSFEQTQACRSDLQVIWLGALAAFIAFHLGAELIERCRAEHRDPLAEHLERHPDRSLAALAPDPRITLGLKLGDGAVVCHAFIKARAGQFLQLVGQRTG